MREQIMPRKAVSKKDDRIQVTGLGEYYDDLLTLDAWINGRSKAQQANSLLCAKLMERETRIKERVRYLAGKRRISTEEMWVRILNGSEDKIQPEEADTVGEFDVIQKEEDKI